MTRTLAPLVVLLVMVVAGPAGPALDAQGAGQGRGGGAGRAGGPPPTPRAQAPIDITGNWVSLVTEDWRWRMVMPKKGDYSSVPLNPEGRRAADAWDPANLATDGCKAYGAAAVMRVPGRLRIAWENDTTLKIETDAGRQTRRLYFDPAQKPGPARTWQGHSAAEWERIQALGGLGVSLQIAPARLGTLEAVTTNLRAGYLRKNGVPYSENAIVTEYFDRVNEFGNEYLIVHTTVDDRQYLNQPFITSTHFKREPDASKFKPMPCEP
jgi:hypothetical protein